MENTLPLLSKSLTKELLDHYLSLNSGLAILGDKVNVHFQGLLLTRRWTAEFWG